MSDCRNLVDHVKTCELALLNRVCGGHDFLLALIALAKQKPWQRIGRSSRLDIYQHGIWKPLDVDRSVVMCPTEAEASFKASASLLLPVVLR